MNSVEFTTKIEHGVIHLPKDHDDLDNTIAHVVVTIQGDGDAVAKKRRLFAAFEKLQERDIFPDIEDPVEWQRKLRDEWE